MDVLGYLGGFFNGDGDAARYIRRFELFSEATGADRRQMLCQFPVLLDGPALDWYDRIEEPVTWEELKAAFISKFVRKDNVEQLLGRLMEMRQGSTESVEDFVTRFDAVCRRMDEDYAPPPLKMTLFRKGLRREFRPYLLKNTVSDMTELYAVAVELEGLLEDGVSLENEASHPRQVAAQPDAEVECLRREVQRLTTLVEGRQQAPRAAKPPKPYQPLICYRCGVEGHKATECARGGPSIPRPSGRIVANGSNHLPEASRANHGDLDANTVDVLPVATRTRAEAEIEEEDEPAPKIRRKPKGRRKKSVEESIRRIRCGVGKDLYSVTDDLFKVQANMTFGQLFQLSPAARRMVREGISVERKVRKGLRGGTGVPADSGVETEPAPDPQVRVPTVVPAQSMDTTLQTPSREVSHEKSLRTSATVNGAEMSKVIVDPGGMVNLLNTRAARRIGVRMEGKADICIRVGDGRRKALEGFGHCPVEVDGVLADTKFYFLDAATSYDVLLGKPWIRSVNAVSDWATDTHIIRDDKGNSGVVKGSVVEDPSPETAMEVIPEDSDENGEWTSEEEQSDSDSEEDADEYLVAVEPESNDQTVETSSEGEVVYYVPPAIDELRISVDNVAELNVSDELSPDQVGEVQEILVKHGAVFAHELSELARTSLVEFKIDEVPGAKPCAVKNAKRLSPEVERFARQKVTELLRAGLIELDDGPYAAQCSFPKKSSGEYRMCHNYIRLNAQTIQQKWPIPSMEGCLDRLAGKRFYSSLDGFSGYFAIPVRECDRMKTAFITPFGKFKYRVMPFGVTSGPACYAKLISIVFGDLVGKGVEVFFDDVGIATNSFKEHLTLLSEVLSRYSAAGMSLNPKKCYFLYSSIAFLGHVVSGQGILPNPAKVEKIRDWPDPRNPSEVRSFVGLASYYRRLVPGFAELSEPLTRLTRKGVAWKWGEPEADSFRRLKDALISPIVMAPPRIGREWMVTVHSSDVAVGAEVSQSDDCGVSRPVYFLSRGLSTSEKNYSQNEKTVLALVWCLKKLRHYLLHDRVVVISGNCALKWIVNKQEVEGRLLRWLATISEFDLLIKCSKDAGPAMHLAHRQIDSSEVDETTEFENEAADVLVLEGDTLIDELVRYLTTLQFREELDPFERKKIRRLSSKYIVQDGKLWYRTSSGKLLRVVRESRINDVIEGAHAAACGGHYAAERTAWKIMDDYYWTTLHRDVKQFCASCDSCQRFGKKGSKAILKPVFVEKPFQMIAIDVIGPLPKSSNGHRFIITAIDYLTRWPEAQSSKKCDARQIQRFLRELMNRFGVPACVLSDNGPCFVCRTTKEFAREVGIKWRHSPPYMPRCNGLDERLNGEILARIKRFCLANSNRHQWHAQLGSALWSIRTSRNRSVGTSPAELLIGFRPQMPINGASELETWDVAMVQSASEIEVPKPNQLGGRSLLLEEKREEAMDCLVRAQLEMVEGRQSYAGPEFKIGDKVLYKNHQKRDKLSPEWYGPVEIINIQKGIYYLDGLKCSFHSDHLKLFRL